MQQYFKMINMGACLHLCMKIKRLFQYELSNMISLKKQQVQLEGNLTIRGKIYIENHGSLTIKENTIINSGKKFNPVGYHENTRIIVLKTGVLKTGKNTEMSNINIYCQTAISIGNNVMIGGGVNIWDTDFHSTNYNERIVECDGNIKSRPIVIEDNVFIGANVTILKGVIIGENSVIGTGSIVSKSIPSNEIWAGNPIRFIKNVTVTYDELSR